jgi:hydrogenase-4 component E
MMNPADILLSLVLLSVLFALVSSRIVPLIKIIAFQGIAVSIFPLLLRPHLSWSSVLFSLVMVSVRGITIPLLLAFAVKRIAIKREIEPLIGYHASLLFGLLLIIFSVYLSGKFHLPLIHGSGFSLPTAITAFVSGLFLLVARRKAITMLIGYLMLENGIYLLGTSLSPQTHSIVEFGILLDVLAGVMIMGIILHNIQRAFDDIDTTLLRALKD